MRVSLASQGCESENVARFHKVAANVEKNLEGQERKRSHLPEYMVLTRLTRWLGLIS